MCFFPPWQADYPSSPKDVQEGIFCVYSRDTQPGGWGYTLHLKTQPQKIAHANWKRKHTPPPSEPASQANASNCQDDDAGYTVRCEGTATRHCNSLATYIKVHESFKTVVKQCLEWVFLTRVKSEEWESLEGTVTVCSGCKHKVRITDPHRAVYILL